MGLNAKLGPSVPERYFSDAFNRVIEYHLDYLRNAPGGRSATLDLGVTLAYDRNFYGVMAHLNIPREFWWIMLRVNGLETPFDYRYTSNTFIIPDRNAITNIFTRMVATELRL